MDRNDNNNGKYINHLFHFINKNQLCLATILLEIETNPFLIEYAISKRAHVGK